MMQVPTPYRLPPGSPVSDPTSSPAAVVADTIVRTVELGVTITDAAVDGETTVVCCDLLDRRAAALPGVWHRRASTATRVERRVTDVPVVGHPLQLRVRVPRYRCVNTGCERGVFAHDTSRLARRGWSTTRRCARYMLRRLMIDRVTVAAVARELGLSWDTVNTIADGRHPDDRGHRRPGPPRRGAGHRGRRAPLVTYPPRRRRRATSP